jgi:hypothetical protein
MTDQETPLDLAELLGAEEDASLQRLTIYVPNVDRHGVEFGDQRQWVLSCAGLLARMGGGCTIEPPVEGAWLDPNTAKLIWERPVLVYAYVRPGWFELQLPALRFLLHEMGRETDQGEVAFEFDGVFYRITEFDS